MHDVKGTNREPVFLTFGLNTEVLENDFNFNLFLVQSIMWLQETLMNHMDSVKMLYDKFCALFLLFYSFSFQDFPQKNEFGGLEWHEGE